MIGLDTSVLVRYMTQDDPVQAARANQLIEALSEKNPGFVTVIAMVETAWVLERAYRFSHAEIAFALEQTLQSAALRVDREQEVFTAVLALKEGRASFADALIGALGETAGCSTTVTLDRRAARLPEFDLL